MRASDIYGLGAAIGFTPREVDQLTPWELMAATDGYNQSQGVKEKPEAPSDERYFKRVAESEARRRKKAERLRAEAAAGT